MGLYRETETQQKNISQDKQYYIITKTNYGQTEEIHQKQTEEIKWS